MSRATACSVADCNLDALAERRLEASCKRMAISHPLAATAVQTQQQLAATPGSDVEAVGRLAVLLGQQVMLT